MNDDEPDLDILPDAATQSATLGRGVESRIRYRVPHESRRILDANRAHIELGSPEQRRLIPGLLRGDYSLVELMPRPSLMGEIKAASKLLADRFNSELEEAT